MKTTVCDFSSKELIKSIREGNVVAFPTETVYGIGVIYDSLEAFNNLVEAKRRSPDKPFTLMLSSKNQVEEFAILNQKAKKVVNHFMPGEITILVKYHDNLFPWVHLNSKYIGIRVSGKKEVCDLIHKVGKPMLVTSANISGEKTCVDFDSTYQVFEGKIPFIVKGETSSCLPSTIVICDENLTLVRQGSISFEDIKKVWED